MKAMHWLAPLRSSLLLCPTPRYCKNGEEIISLFDSLENDVSDYEGITVSER